MQALPDLPVAKPKVALPDLPVTAQALPDLPVAKAAPTGTPIASDPFFNPQAPTQPGIQKDIYDFAQRTGDTLKAFPGRVVADFKSGMEGGDQAAADLRTAEAQIPNNDTLGKRFSSTVEQTKDIGKGLLSDFNALLAPVTATGQTVGDVARDLTGSQDIGDRANLLTQMAIPLGPKGARTAEDVGKVAPEVRAAEKVASEAPVAADAFATAPKPGTAPMAPRPPLPDLPVTPPDKGPTSLGAAAPGEAAPLPETPTRDTLNTQEDKFFALRQNATADKVELTQKAQAMPKAIQDPALQQRLYAHMEGDPNVILSPQEKALYDQHVQPLKDEEQALYIEAKKYQVSEEDLNPNYAHRIVKGKAPQFDALSGEASGFNPIGGNRSLPRSTSSLQARSYYAIEDGAGTRKLVAQDKAGNLSTIEKGQATRLMNNDPTELKPGSTVSIGGKDWKITDARTSEIEANTNTRYYKNAVTNTLDNIARLRVVVRALHEIDRLKASPEWAAYARPYNDRMAPMDWRTPNMPQFRDWKVDPKLADVMDDFYGKRGTGLGEALNKINQFAVGSMFWQPITHSLNTGGHWIVARGWDWVTPSGIKSTFVDTSNALKEVVTQGPKFQQMLRAGSAQMSAGLNNKEFYTKLAQTFGEQVVKDPKRWNPLIRAFGFVGANAAADFVKSFYGAMSKVLWKVNDVFMMQRVMELERKGMSTAEAIKSAERHIPNYRIPSEVLGSRTAQQIITAPVINSFSRYHYGAMTSFGHMASDLLKGDAKTKFEATGHIAALAFLGFFAAPWINKSIQMATGNPKASGGARGPWAIPSNLRDMYNGDAGIFQGLSRFITISPLLKTAGETMTNRDWFTGKNIVEPGDQRQGRYAAMAGQTAEHLGENLVSPYNAATTAARQGKALPRSLVEQSFGISDPSPTQEAKKDAAIKRQNTDAQSRHKHPKGFIEGLGNQLQGLQ